MTFAVDRPIATDQPGTPIIRDWAQPSDRPQPDLVGLQASNPQRYPGLFHSSGDSGWDVLFAFPQDVARISAADGLHVLQAHPAMHIQPQLASLTVHDLPFTGGWLCALAYELGGVFEPSVGLAADADFPLAWLARIPAAILFERDSGRCVLVAEPGQHALIDAMMHDLAQILPPVPALPERVSLQEEDPAAFLDGVECVQDYIRAGDVFQVNLSRGWQAEFDSPVAPASLFVRLMQKNPAPFSALLQMEAWVQPALKDTSRGPVPGEGLTKPDVTAPGYDVMSAVPGEGYVSSQGTSMAGPMASVARKNLGKGMRAKPAGMLMRVRTPGMTRPKSTMPARSIGDDA